jgi:hypothetical protein
MKNRYGMDGMTYSAKISTNTGDIQISQDTMSDDELNFDNGQQNGQQKNFGGLDSQERAYLANKFFELNS